MTKCYFCYKKMNLETERYGIYLHQGTEDYQFLKAFVCQSCDRGLGDDDVKGQVADILKERTDSMNAIIKDLAKRKVKGFEHINIKD